MTQNQGWIFIKSIRQIIQKLKHIKLHQTEIMLHSKPQSLIQANTKRHLWNKLKRDFD